MRSHLLPYLGCARSSIRLLPLFALCALLATPALAQSPQRALQPAEVQPAEAPTPAPSWKLLRGGLVTDPSFEDTPSSLGDNPHWDEFSVALGSPFANSETFGFDLARTGDYFAIFGFADETGIDYVEQDVSVPAAGDYVLTFYFAGGNDRDDDGVEEADGTLRALVDGEAVYELTAEEAPDYDFNVYNEVTVPVSFDAAGTYAVRVELEVIANPGTDDVYQVILDDVTLTEVDTGDESATHDTGLVELGVYADGQIGTQPDAFTGPGFTFDGEQGLFSATFLVGQGSDQVSGMAYEDAEWETVQLLQMIDPPYPGFDMGYEAVYSDALAPNPIGIEVTQRSYSSMEDGQDAFVLMEFTVENTSGGPLTGLYPGAFFDWDIGDFESNLADYDPDTQLLYAYEDGATGSAYFGFAALDTDVSGYAFDAGGGFNPTEADLWDGLTTMATPPTTPDDRRTVLGTGPFDLADGESFTITFAVVGGPDLAGITENAATAMEIVSAPADPIIDTGVIRTEVFTDGYFGANFGAGEGFMFDGAQTLFEGQFLLGLSADEVIGNVYGQAGATPWEMGSELQNTAPPAGFDIGLEGVFQAESSVAEVTQRTYAAQGDPFVILEYHIENTSGSDFPAAYPGIFADWDVGDFNNNVGGYDEGTNLLYVYEDVATSTYVGVAALESNPVPVSGYTLSASIGANPIEADLWNGLTTFGETTVDPEDRRTVIGVGPYAIADGESVMARFAVVAGSDLDEVIANAAEAQARFMTAGEDDGVVAEGFGLEAVYPNPLRSAATVRFVLPEAGDVRVSVYDVLGREVARLADGAAAAGPQEVAFDAAGLAAGVYVVRLEAGADVATKRVVVVR